jgi:hypothetical protein
VAECGGLLNVPLYYRFNLSNNLEMEERVPKWDKFVSFGKICSPFRSPFDVGAS